MLLALAAIWGASFLFIEIALRELAPEAVILFRIGSGALALGIFVALRGIGFAGLRAYLLPLALMGAFNTALPFFLITWGQQYIDSGLAAIFNASAPIFVPSLALVYGAVLLDETISALALVGLALVLSGVALGTRRTQVAS
jgi:drug/metabolite transporter (DMT)-like permease